ncbi:E1 [Gull papillomavirus 1]|uniref:DNA 3'-5' helicase n=1 Tax=Gull papillomavirus 1 TaxID=2562547 RepID=A0AAE6D2X9_9PAPI|nr:E1 [Gull papillomavirus 1]
MDFILTEAEEEGVTGWEEDTEEETEDTGIGTYSQLFAEDAEIDTYSSPGEDDCDHRALLHEQQRRDDNHVLSELGYLFHPKKRRYDDGGGHGSPHDAGSDTGAEPQGLRDSALQRPAEVCDILRRRVPAQNATSPIPPSAGTLDRYTVRSSGTVSGGPLQRLREDASSKDAIRKTTDTNTTRPALRPVLATITNTCGNEGARGLHQKQPDSGKSPAGGTTQEQDASQGAQLLQRILTAKNTRNTQLAIFKELYGPSYTDVTRTFKSDKTQSYEWVFVILGSASIAYEALRECLKTQTQFILCDVEPSKQLGLFYCGFNASKNREGVRRCLKHFNVDVTNIPLCDPPNKRSITAALFFQRLMACHGEAPVWCRDLIATGELKNGEGFQLSKMVQWAMDHNICEEGQIAFGYAQLAETDANAQLWLSSNSQAKYVRDATIMVKHFNRGRLHATPMTEHIAVRMREYVGEDDEEGWKQIIVFLRYQHVPLNDFLQVLRYWLKGRPKKSTIAILGVPDSGKTMFTMSLMKFMDGRILNYANSKSHFWLQPLLECKAAAIDDVTFPCWDYINLYLRPALDGTSICIDCKHRAPVQAKCPPLILTSNYDPRDVTGAGEERYVYKYLFSRISFICFNRVIPQVGGRPRFLVLPEHWRSFLLKYKAELDLDLEEYDYGQSTEPAEDTGGAAGAGE